MIDFYQSFYQKQHGRSINETEKEKGIDYFYSL